MSKVIEVSVYKFDELTPKVQERLSSEARERVSIWKNQDYQDLVIKGLEDTFPDSNLSINYSLSNCQGDGANIEGTIMLRDMVNVCLTDNERDAIDSDLLEHITNNPVEIKLSENNGYSYSRKNIDIADSENTAARAIEELYPDAYCELTDARTDQLIEMVDGILIKTFNKLAEFDRQIEVEGYKFLYDTDEEVKHYYDGDWFLDDGHFMERDGA